MCQEFAASKCADPPQCVERGSLFGERGYRWIPARSRVTVRYSAFLDTAESIPERPYIAILGGAKVSDKIEVIQSLLAKADSVLIGGAMAYTFLKAQGQDVGRSLAEDDQKETALNILQRARERKVDFWLPVDHVLATATDAAEVSATVPAPPFPPGLLGVDIGPKTVDAYARLIASAKTISTPAFTSSSRLTISTSFCLGKTTTCTPARWAARTFSRMPLTGRMRPERVTSPLKATSRLAGRPVSRESRARAMVIPEEGPSLGMAPEGR